MKEAGSACKFSRLCADLTQSGTGRCLCYLSRSSGPIAVFVRKKRLESCPDRFNQPSDAEDAHHPFDIGGKHVKAYLGAYSR